MAGAERIKALGHRALPHLEKIAFLAAAVLGLVVAGRYIWVAIETVPYPYMLEWMEGGSAETAARILAFQSIYPEPSIDYVGYIYTPLYYVAAALSSAVFGESLSSSRLVSVVATLGVCAYLFAFLRRESVPTKWAVFAPLLWLATYEYSGRWLFIARVDSLFIFFLIAALYGMRFWESRRAIVGTALLMWLAFLTKQSAVLALFPAGLAVLALDWRRGLMIGGLFTVLAGGSILVMNQMTDGWFWYYVYEVPTRHAVAERLWIDFWRHDLWKLAPLFALVLPALGLLVTSDKRAALFYVGALVGVLAASWSSRLHTGGVENVLMPAFLMTCLMAPLGAWLLETRLAKVERRVSGTSPTMIAILGVLAYQLAAAAYPLGDMIPDEAHYADGEQMMEYLESAEGEVMLPDHRWIQRQVGQPSFGLGMAAMDILRLPPGPDRGRDAFIRSMNEALASRRFSEIILADGGFMRRQLEVHYCYARDLPASPEPVTGWRIHPQFVWVPRTPQTVTAPGRRHECPAGLQRPR